MAVKRNTFIWRTVWVLFILMMTSYCNLYAKEHEPLQKHSGDSNKPIQITSDRLDAYKEKKLVVFSGNAVAKQGDRIIKADQILLYYRNLSGEQGKKAPGNSDEMGDLEKIEAKGHVVVTQGERIVTGDHAVYSQDDQKISMTGHAAMREGRNIIGGDKVVVYLNEDRGIVESEENKRVKATIYPEDRKK